MTWDQDRRWSPADVVPRRMLELCKDTLRRCLARNVELRDRIDRLEAEVARLHRLMDRRGGK